MKIITLTLFLFIGVCCYSQEKDFKEALYAPEYYPYLKEFMSTIVDVQKNATIVIKKI